MRSLRWAPWFVGFLFIFVFVANATAEPTTVPGQYLIRFAPQTKTVQSTSVQAQLGVQLVESNELTGSHLVETAPGQDFNDSLAKELLAQGVVEYIEPNYIYSINDTVPNDPSFSQLWGLHNYGQTGGSLDVDIDAPAAWDLSVGSTAVVVGVVDTGVNYQHPDLAPNIWVNPGEIPGNGVDDDGNGVIDDIHGFDAISNSGNPIDENGHGTHVAGTIAGAGNNGLGVTGVSWNVKILALRFLDGAGFGSTQDAIEAIEYAIRLRQAGVNIRVLSNSWGGGGHSQALEDAVRAANNVGILFVAAAGNSSNDNDFLPNYPSNYEQDNVVAVAAIDHSGNLASFSNYGANTVDVAAPGVDIFSTWLGSGYTTLSGTSMAAPHVSGVAALVASREPGLSVAALRERVIHTIKPLPTLLGAIFAPGTVSAMNALTDSRTPLPDPNDRPNYSNSAIPLAADPIGTKVISTDDGYYEVVLPFDFPYFEKQYRRLAVSANGRILPLAEGEELPLQLDYSNQQEPGLSPYHDDLYPSPHSAEGGVSVFASSDHLTVSWVVVHYAHRESGSSAQEIRFQAKLYSDGRIEYHYLDTEATDTALSFGASATIGVFVPTGVLGNHLLLSHNTSSPALVGSNRAQRFSIEDRTRVAVDFDGDGKREIVVWRPSSGVWYVLPSVGGYDYANHWSLQHGLSGDFPKIGDFDRDGKPDFAVWRPTTGMWYFRYSGNNYATLGAIQWGLYGDLPLVADYDGDGFDDIGVYRVWSGTFYVLASSAGFNRSRALLGDQDAMITVQLGGPFHDIVAGDFTGNGKADFVTVWQPARYWAVKDSTDQLRYSLPWGFPGDATLGCDFDGDRVDERVVTHINGSSFLDWYGVDQHGGVSLASFGVAGDWPLCHDQEGDGKDDRVVFRWWSGEWFILQSSTGQWLHRQFGLPGDWPL